VAESWERECFFSGGLESHDLSRTRRKSKSLGTGGVVFSRKPHSSFVRSPTSIGKARCTQTVSAKQMSTQLHHRDRGKIFLPGTHQKNTHPRKGRNSKPKIQPLSFLGLSFLVDVQRGQVFLFTRGLGGLGGTFEFLWGGLLGMLLSVFNQA